ncbi:MAG: hypothetical protein AB7T38_06605 [Nitrospirales bacterium]
MKACFLSFCRCTTLLIVIVLSLPMITFGEEEKGQIQAIAQEISRDLKNLRPLLQLRVLASLGLAQARSEDIFSAKFTFKESLAHIPLDQEEWIKGNIETIMRSLFIIYRNQYIAGDRTGCEWTMKKSKEVCMEYGGNPGQYPNCYDEMVIAQAQTGDHQSLKESLQILLNSFAPISSIKTEWHSQAALLPIANGLWNVGKNSEAENIIEDFMKMGGQGSFWRKEISVLLAKLGKKDMAIHIFNEQKPGTSFQKLDQVKALCRLAEGFRVGGNRGEARLILGEAFSLLNSLRKEKLEFQENGLPKVENFEDTPFFPTLGLVPIGKLQAHLHEFAAAEQILEETRSDFKDQILFALLETQLERGDVEESRKIAERMTWRSTDVMRTQIQFGDITGAKLTMEKFIVDYNNLEWIKEHKKSLQTTEEHPEYHQNLRMIGAARARIEELGPLLEWARSQPSQELKIFALLGIAEGLVGIDNTICCMGYPYEPSPFRM